MFFLTLSTALLSRALMHCLTLNYIYITFRTDFAPNDSTRSRIFCSDFFFIKEYANFSQHLTYSH